MPMDEFVAQVDRVGCAVVASRADIDPADKKMYALRDVTGTVPSIPLIVGSIISKKVAGGADVIVLDVKVGSGAFMKTEESARELAAALTATGRALDRRVSCVLTDMDQPLGRAVGNGLEVAEAVRCLSGEGPADLTDLCVGLGAKMVVGAERAADEVEAGAMLEDAIASGRALETFERWIEAQGGDPAVAHEPSTVLPIASASREVRVERGGFVAGFDAEGVGRAAMVMGAGRAKAGDDIDPAAGLVLAVKLGDELEDGGLLATVYAASESQLDEGEARLQESVRFGDEPPALEPLFREV
jgi:pyrimidine-nucleoside phosphorylase